MKLHEDTGPKSIPFSDRAPDDYMGELLERVAQLAEDAALFHAQQAAHYTDLGQGWRDAVSAGQALRGPQRKSAPGSSATWNQNKS